MKARDYSLSGIGIVGNQMDKKKLYAFHKKSQISWMMNFLSKAFSVSIEVISIQFLMCIF